MFAGATAKAAEVVWYVTGRFYSKSEQTEDVGYFLHLQGIGGPLFAGPPSESTALFTFAATPFAATTITNGSLEIGVDAKGTFRIFLRDHCGASFDDPRTFSAGRCIATFDRVAIVPTTKVGLSETETLMMNVFTARLRSSEPFDFDGARYDLRDLIGYGVTQWGTAAAEPETPPAGYASAVPFVGSAIRAGL